MVHIKSCRYVPLTKVILPVLKVGTDGQTSVEKFNLMTNVSWFVFVLWYDPSQIRQISVIVDGVGILITREIRHLFD